MNSKDFLKEGFIEDASDVHMDHEVQMAREECYHAAEHALAMLMDLARSIPQATASMRAKKWEKKKFMGTEIYNKTLGVIGMGKIGSVVAERARGLKLNVVVYDPFVTPAVAERLGVGIVSLDDLFARADFITVHTPTNKDTENLINKEP